MVLFKFYFLLPNDSYCKVNKCSTIQSHVQFDLSKYTNGMMTLCCLLSYHVRAGSHYSTLKWCALLLSPLPTIVPLTRILVFWLIVPQGLLLVVKVNKIKVVTSCHFLDSTRVSRLQLSDWSICFQRCWPVKANRKEFYFITAALNSAETRGNGDCNWWPPWERLNTIELVNSVRRA